MEVRVIASSSEGNAYVIQNEGEALLIEAGHSFKDTLAAIDYQVDKIVGCLITHEHGDHSSHVNEFLSYGLPVYASLGTIHALAGGIKSEYQPRAILRAPEGGYSPLTLGGFTIYPFATKHDAEEPLGFYIWHDETGGILFATDTYYLSNTFDDLSQILIECNYHPAMLERNAANREHGMSWSLARRIRASHLSIDTCLKTLKANDLSKVNNIILIHISHANGNAAAFKQAVEHATGIPTSIAHPGLTINLDINPF
jgi:phosphoribosyl 1,2-cyclic phosphodiesterase